MRMDEEQMLLLARETAAELKDVDDAHHAASLMREGKWDDTLEVRLILVGIKAAVALLPERKR